jgi:IS605 OrfB family transposase
MDDLGGRYKSLIYKHASEIVRACKARKGKISKPTTANVTINFSLEFVKIEESSNSFDQWVRLRLPFIKQGTKRERVDILIPIKNHRHSLKFQGWERASTVTLSQTYISFIFDKPTPAPKKVGRAVGIDIGYTKLLATSDGDTYGKDMVQIYGKISRKVRGSKAFKRSLTERNNKINEIINKEICLTDVKTLVVEDLKNVKHKSKFSKKFNNKLQRWAYPNVISKLERKSEEEAVQFIRVHPAYTSQICSKCGFRHANNRLGEKFKCMDCGIEMDADINASINILHRGVCNLPAQF